MRYSRRELLISSSFLGRPNAGTQPTPAPMSVLDVLVHKMGARAAKIRLDKLKESENDAVVSVYSDYFFDPFDDESPQDKATREEEEKEEAELEEAEEAMWSSVSVGEGLYEELAVGDIHVFPMETSTFDEIQT